MKNTLKETIDRIIKEELAIATMDGTSSTATSQQKVTAQKEMTKGNNVNFVKKGANLQEDDLSEMARIATYVKVGDPKIFADVLQSYQGKWLGDMLAAVQAAGETGLTQPEMVQAAGKKQQQDINPYVRKLLASNALALGSPSKEKTVKDTVPGALGRRPTEQGIKAKLEKALLDKFKAEPEYAPKQELIDQLGQEKIDSIKALAAQGGPKRGRRMGGSTAPQEVTEGNELEEMARIATYVKVGNPEAFAAAKQQYKGTWVEDMLDAVAGSEQGMTQPEMVVAAGKKQQQDINPYVRKLQASGALELGAPSKEKIVRDTVPGALGRRPTEDGIKKRLAAELLKTFMEKPKFKPKAELVKVLGQEEIDRIKLLASQGGPRRGRQMGSGKPKELDEMARVPTLYQIGDLEKLNSLPEKARNSRIVTGIIEYIEQEGPQKIIDIATNKFNTRQQAINPVVQNLVSVGVLEPVEGSGKAAVVYNKRGDIRQTTQQRKAAKPDAEDYFIGNHNALGNGEDNDEEVDVNFAGNGESSRIEDEFGDGEIDPSIDDTKIEKTTSNVGNISDEEYANFMDYLRYTEQLAKLKSAVTSNKKLNRKSDDLKGSTGDAEQDRILALRDKIQAKVDDLIATSPFIQKKIAKQNGTEYVPPVVDDVDKELAGVDDEDELDETFLNEGTMSRFKVLANI